MGRVFDEDVRTLAQDPRIDWDILDNRRVLVTGATGLIGRLIAYALITRNEIEGIHTKVILPARNIARAAALFDAHADTEIVPWDAFGRLYHPPRIEHRLQAHGGGTGRDHPHHDPGMRVHARGGQTLRCLHGLRLLDGGLWGGI